MVDVERPNFLLQILLCFSIAFYISFQNITIHSLIDIILKGFVNRDAVIPFSQYHRDVAILKTLFDHGSTVRHKRRCSFAYSLITLIIFKYIKLFP